VATILTLLFLPARYAACSRVRRYDPGRDPAVEGEARTQLPM
jgi:hypothetical protein